MDRDPNPAIGFQGTHIHPNAVGIQPICTQVVQEELRRNGDVLRQTGERIGALDAMRLWSRWSLSTPKGYFLASLLVGAAFAAFLRSACLMPVELVMMSHETPCSWSFRARSCLHGGDKTRSLGSGEERMATMTAKLMFELGKFWGIHII